MSVEAILMSVLGGVVSLFFWFIKHKMTKSDEAAKETAKRLEELEKTALSLQTTAVTDSHVRKVVKEEMEPIAQQLGKLLEVTHSIEVYMAEDRGYKAAQSSMNKRKQDLETR